MTPLRTAPLAAQRALCGKAVLLFTTLAAGLALAGAAQAQDNKVLNLYSARHYQTDEALYANFTKATGIKINRLEGKEDELVERIRNEGAASPADILITVDATRMEVADRLGLFQPLNSAVLEQRLPATLRTPNWAAFSTRARVIVFNRTALKKEQLQNYEDLANPALKGQVCMRSGGHPYNLSLGGALLAHNGEARTETWARGVVANFARAPKGGDTDQLMALAAGECGVTVSNTYYLVRLLRSTRPADIDAAKKLGTVWPNQASQGTHINVSGAGILKHAPNRDAARRFLEYLASDEAQGYFANGNNEWPAVKSVVIRNPELESLGSFKADTLPVAELARNTALAQKVFDRAGWK
jgi:iron(III) transport system substrate-binding protein